MSLVRGDPGRDEQDADAVDRGHVAPARVCPHELTQRGLVGVHADARCGGEDPLSRVDVCGLDAAAHEPREIGLLRTDATGGHLLEQRDGVIDTLRRDERREQRSVAAALRERPGGAEPGQPAAGLVEASRPHEPLHEVACGRPVEDQSLVEQGRGDGQGAVEPVRGHLRAQDGPAALRGHRDTDDEQQVEDPGGARDVAGGEAEVEQPFEVRTGRQAGVGPHVLRLRPGRLEVRRGDRGREHGVAVMARQRPPGRGEALCDGDDIVDTALRSQCMEHRAVGVITRERALPGRRGTLSDTEHLEGTLELTEPDQHADQRRDASVRDAMPGLLHAGDDRHRVLRRAALDRVDEQREVRIRTRTLAA